MLTELQTRYPKLLKDGAFVIDNSNTESIITCPRRAEYKVVEKRELDQSKGALNFGSAIHKAMDIRYRSSSTYADSSVLAAEITALQKHFEEFPQEIDEWRTPSLGVEVLEQYHRDHMVEPFTIYQQGGKPWVEIPFITPIGTVGDIPCLWQGKIDTVVEWSGLWIGDHKTTSIMGPSYFEQFKNSSQFIGYCWAFEQITNERVKGAFINALGIRKPTKSGKGIEFCRDRVPYTRDQIAEWQRNTMAIISNFLHMALDNYFPMHTAWCVAKFGKCEYFDVCTLPEASRKTLLNSRVYKDATWSPLD